MDNKQPLQVTIIGGGFCGIVTAINLLQNNACPLHLNIINKGNPLGRGVAYSPASASHLLNVPNGKMGAFADKPGHFVSWLRRQPGYDHQLADVLASEFSPRELYGCYISELWNEALLNKNAGCSIAVYNDYAVRLVELDNQYYIYLEDNPVLASDVVVLATGNALPRLPSGLPIAFGDSAHYFGNPWTKAGVENLQPGGDVLIIGNGLTMADTVISLVESGFQKTIYTISPHGYNLNIFKEDKIPYAGLDVDRLLAGGKSLYWLVKNLNRHRKAAEYLEQSAYPIVDSLRPHVQQIWQSFSAREREQFLYHLRHLWGSTRHRLPGKTHRLINELYVARQVITYKGKVKNVARDGAEIVVTLNCGADEKTVRVQRIINCTGPEGNPALSSNRLLRDLEKNGLICTDDLGMGIKADPLDGSVITPDGSRKENLFVIGSGLKGVLWESTAVPELRIQAKHLADLITEKARARHPELMPGLPPV